MDSEKLRRIYQLVRTRRWFAQKHLVPTQIRVEDSLAFEGDDARRYLWLLLVIEPETRTYSVVVAEDDDGALVMASPASLMEAVRQRQSLQTARGGLITFTEPTPAHAPSGADRRPGLDYQPLAAGSSSNSLFLTDLGNEPSVAKFYRKIDGTGAREQQTLMAMQATGITPRLLGAIDYRAPALSAPPQNVVLCLYLELIGGRPAFEPFQTAARRALSLLQAGTEAAALLHDEACILPELCIDLGEGIASFHVAAQSLSEPDPGQAPLELGSFLAELTQRWDRLVAHLDRSNGAPSLPRSDRTALAAMLDRLAQTAKAQPHDLPRCFSHGDLHLSHLILAQGVRRCRIIDPSHGLGQPGGFDHCARDLFQIRRGFEGFIFDEVATQLAGPGGSRDDAAARLASAADAHAARLMRFAAAWSSQVFERVAAAYSECLPPPLRSPMADPRWCAAFYLDRLFHELDYDVAYGRRFFLSADFAFLQTFLRKAEDHGLVPQTAASA